MNWRDYIESDEDVLAGKPVVKGTRLAVGFLLDLLAQGWSESEILENYPQLEPEDMRAVYAFTAECMRDEHYLRLDRPR